MGSSVGAGMVYLGLYYIKHCWLFNAKSCVYIYVKYIWFGLGGLHDITTIIGYNR